MPASYDEPRPRRSGSRRADVPSEGSLLHLGDVREVPLGPANHEVQTAKRVKPAPLALNGRRLATRLLAAAIRTPSRTPSSPPASSASDGWFTPPDSTWHWIVVACRQPHAAEAAAGCGCSDRHRVRPAVQVPPLACRVHHRTALRPFAQQGFFVHWRVGGRPCGPGFHQAPRPGWSRVLLSRLQPTSAGSPGTQVPRCPAGLDPSTGSPGQARAPGFR